MGIAQEQIATLLAQVGGINARIVEMNKQVQEVAKNGDLGAVREFINAGADNFDTIASLAADNKHLDIFQLALENGANNFNNIAYRAAYNGCIEIFVIALEKGADDINGISSAAESNGRENFLMKAYKYANEKGYTEKATRTLRLCDPHVANATLYERMQLEPSDLIAVAPRDSELINAVK